jgi:hypothetical protein
MTFRPAWIGGLTMGSSRKGLARQFVELLDCVTFPSLVLEMSSRWSHRVGAVVTVWKELCEIPYRLVL